jgi:O-antigen ligase/Flp pilus assembly protein TadD
VSRTRTPSVAAGLAALHDTALLTAVFYAPIFWGQVCIPETSGAGQISASGGQTLAAGLVFLALLTALLARWASGKPPARLPNAIHLPAALLLVVAAISTLSSANPHAGKIELGRLLVGFLLFYLVANRATLPASRPGVVAAAFACSLVLTAFIPIPEEAGRALMMLTVIALGIAVAVMVTQREDSDPAAWLRNALILSAALVVALYGCWEKFAVAREAHDPTWNIFSTFFNPNMLGGFLAMMFPLALSAALADRTLTRRLLWGFCAIMLAATIYPTNSKGAAVACAAALLLYLVLLARQSPRLRKLAGAVVIVGVLAALIAAVGAWQVPPVQAWLADALRLKSPSNMFRILTWKGTLQLFDAYPWLGAGPGTFKYVYPRYAIAGYVEAAHENYLQMFAELGVVGGIVFLWLLASILLTGRRAIASASDFPGRVWAIGGVCAVAALMVHSLLDYDWYIGAINFGFWLVAGMLAYRAHGYRAPEPPAAAVEKTPARRGRQRAQAASVPGPTPETPGRAFRWPSASGNWLSFTLCWGALVAVACAAAWFSIDAPARNALAQPAIDTGDQYVMSGANEAGAMALDQYDHARQLDPGWWQAWERYGLVLGKMQGLDKGVEAIRRARDLSPTNFRPWSSMGQLYQEFGKMPEAIQCDEKALALFPNRTITMRNLAEAYAKGGEQQKALEMYQHLAAGEDALYNRYAALAEINVDTNFAFAHYELGRADEQAHILRGEARLGQALAQYAAALRIIAEYHDRAEKTDNMFAMLRRPRENRGPEMVMLEAKTRYRASQVYHRVNMLKEAEDDRSRATTLWSGVEQAIAAEDGPSGSQKGKPA